MNPNLSKNLEEMPKISHDFDLITPVFLLFDTTVAAEKLDSGCVTDLIVP